MNSPSSSTSNKHETLNTNENGGTSSSILPPIPNSSSTSLSANSSMTPLPGVEGLALKENHPFGAAFSLASLDQGNSRGSLSLMNLNVGLGFDHTVFLKSGSFESLNALLFGNKDPNASGILSNINATNVSSNVISSTTPTPVEVKIQPVSSPTSNQQSQPISLPLPLPMSQNIQMSSIQPPSNSPITVKTMSNGPSSIPSNVIATGPPTLGAINNGQVVQSYGNNALIQPKESEKRMIERRDDSSKFVDVTPFLTLPQHEAAKKLGIPSSTLAKRWKEASCNRKWPYRTVSKLDKEILTLLKNVENAKAELSPSVEATLGLLLKRRQEELKTVLVRL